jgi:hypothetical protein
MSRTKVESVKCKVGNQNLTCVLAPGFEYSMINSKTLKRIGCKVSSPIFKYERECKFFREMTTTPIGWATITLTFTAKNRSITTETEALVVEYNQNMEDEILLGTPWFIGRSLDNKKPINNYKAKIVLDMPHAFVRSFLYIKARYSKNKKWVRVPVSITYRELKKEINSDTSSYYETDSSDSYDSDNIYK